MPGVLGNILEYKGGQGCPSGMKWVSIWGTNSLKGVLKETEETIGLLGDLMGGQDDPQRSYGHLRWFEIVFRRPKVLKVGLWVSLGFKGSPSGAQSETNGDQEGLTGLA